MRLIDVQFLETPWYGSRQMARHLRREGYVVGRKRIRRLMAKIGLAPIYQRPRTTVPNPEHQIFPYLLRDLAIDRPNQVWCADITYLPMRRGFLYLVAVMDWATRKVLAWRVSNTMDVEFCIEALEEALAQFGRPEIFNTDQGSQFTSPRFTGILQRAGVRISMDGRGRWMDNVFIERLWRSLKYECVYHAFETGSEVRAGLSKWIGYYCLASQHPSGYVVENWRATWPGDDPAGWFGFLLARLTRSRAAGPVRTARLKIQGPSGSGCMASIQPASTARRSVFGLICRKAAALLRLSQGASFSGTRRWTGMPWWERRAVTRSRFQRFPCPVLSPLRFSMPAMTSSDPMRTSWRTAAMMSGEVLLR